MKFITTQNESITIMYFALQYLSNAARCYLPKQEDDAHLDVSFSYQDKCFSIRLIEDPRCSFSFNYQRFTLEWVLNNRPNIIRLNGTSHKQLLKWTRGVAKQSGFEKTYKYVAKNKEQFAITNDYVFQLSDVRELEHMINMRRVAHEVIENTLNDLGIQALIRVKPYELSSSAKAVYEIERNVTLEIGFSVPDTTSKEHYYYLIGYKGNRKINIVKMPSLRIGYWAHGAIKGAVLPVDNYGREIVNAFFQEALLAYENGK